MDIKKILLEAVLGESNSLAKIESDMRISLENSYKKYSAIASNDKDAKKKQIANTLARLYKQYHSAMSRGNISKDLENEFSAAIKSAKKKWKDSGYTE